MAPTLEPREIAWYEPVTSSTEFRRGDVVALSAPDLGAKIIPSRVVGLPGDSVEIREGELLINGKPVAEPYIDPARAEQDYSTALARITVPSDHVWLLGDFRDMSKDSRHLGPVSSNALVGRVTRAHLPGSHSSPRHVE